MDNSIKLVLKIDDVEIERVSIVTILEQMEYNKWNNPSLLIIGNVELRLERERE